MACVLPNHPEGSSEMWVTFKRVGRTLLSASACAGPEEKPESRGPDGTWRHTARKPSRQMQLPLAYGSARITGYHAFADARLSLLCRYGRGSSVHSVALRAY